MGGGGVAWRLALMFGEMLVSWELRGVLLVVRACIA
jgi:hypothetical protein